MARSVSLSPLGQGTRVEGVGMRAPAVGARAWDGTCGCVALSWVRPLDNTGTSTLVPTRTVMCVHGHATLRRAQVVAQLL